MGIIYNPRYFKYNPMGGNPMSRKSVDFKVFIITFLSAIVLCSQGLAGNLSGKALKKWTDRVIPLPREISVSGSIQVPAGEIYASPAPGKVLQFNTAEKWLKSFAKAGNANSALVIVNMKFAAPESQEANYLKKLKNSGQAYLIRSLRQNGKTVINLYSLTPTGLLYAARTLQSLVMPPAKTDASAKLEMPVVDVTDWPCLEERGQWAQDPTPSIPWYGKWKINFIEFNAYPGIDKKGNPIVRIRDSKLNMASRYGIKAVAFLPHIASLAGNAGITRARFKPEYKHLKDALGKPIEGNNGLCLSSPVTRKLISGWLMLIAKKTKAHHNELEVWFTEGNRHCSCPKCKGREPKLHEMEVILKAYEQVKKKYPDMRLRLWLSQGTYRAKVHDKIINRLPEGIGLVYYNGTRTYISDHNEMLPDNLAEFSRKGGFLGVVPQFSNSWATIVPWTGPQFVKFRLDEFTGKDLNSVAAYTVPSREFHEFNMMAFAEWGWNPKGRTPEEFAKAYAVVKGMKNPDLFAKWAMLAGEAGWELADSRFYSSLNYDPAMGFYGDKPFDHRFAYEKNNYKADLPKMIGLAKQALKLAEQAKNPDMLIESRFLLASLQAYQLLTSLSKKFRRPELTEAEKVKIAAELDQLDEYSQTVADNLLEWKSKIMPKIKRRLPGEARLESTVRALFKTCEILRVLALAKGISDGHRELRGIELGQWKTSDFKDGNATFNFNITDLLMENSDRWKNMSLEVDWLNGYRGIAANAIIYRVNLKTGKKTELFDLRKSGQHPNVFKQLFRLPAPKYQSGTKLELQVTISAACPLPDQYPENRKVNKLECIGTIYLRRIMKEDKLTSLKASKLLTSEATKSGLSVKRRKPGEPISVGVYSGHGTGEIVKALNKQAGIKAFQLAKINLEELGKCNVLIIPQTSQATRLIHFAGDIAAWVKNGGGALLLHDAVGFRRQMPLFRTIGIGVDNPKLSKVKTVKKHPVTKGLTPGKYFSPGFRYDHVIIEPGSAANALVVNEKNQAVTVAGNIGRGRVILNGMLTGFTGAPNEAGGRVKEPAGKELRLLVNSVNWLAGGVNLVTDSGAESITVSDNKLAELPPGWGKHVGNGRAKFGVTSETSHSGKNSAYATLTKWGKNRKGDPDANFGIMLGKTNGGNGSEALPVEPDSTYCFSFWMKGNLPRVSVRVFTWKSPEANVKSRKINHPVKEPVNLYIDGAAMKQPTLRRGIGIKPDPDKWHQYQGTFLTGPETTRAAVRIGISYPKNMKIGDIIYIDDAEVFKRE